MAEFTDIEKQLMERIAESRLRESLASIRNAVEKIWADDAPRIIQDYTDHGTHHSERLADYAAQLLAINDGRPLSSEETYLLMAGIYLHDIGMQCDVVKYSEIKAKAETMGAKFDVEFTAKTASSYTTDEQKAIRENHHLLTGAWIDHARRSGKTVLGPAIRTVPDELVGDLISVCKYHAKLAITECPATFTLNEQGRRQLVAALVRFADELDMDGHRVSIETVKNFRLDPWNAVYWWLHQLTKVIITGNVITLIVRLCPNDEQKCGSLVREEFIKKFQAKNRSVLGVLRWNNIPIAISADSGVVPYEYADPLPDDIVQAFQLIWQRKGVLDALSEEVKIWLEASGYEVSDLQNAQLYKAAQQELTKRKRAEQLLRALNQAALVAEKALTPEQIFTAVAEQFKKLGFSCAVYLADESQNKLFPKYFSYDTELVKAAETLVGLKIEDFSIPIETADVYRKVVWEREIVFVENAEEVLRQLLPEQAKKFAGPIVRMLNVPKSIVAALIVEDEVFGVFSVQSDDLTEEDVPSITAFAHQMAATWRKAQTEQRWAKEELQQSYLRLQRILANTVSALASAVEMRDPYTAGHQRRVTQLACAIANKMGLPNEQIEGIRMAGLIHDIGKINVPPEIFSKPGPLTELEYGLIRAHPQLGHDVLKAIDFPWPVAQIVLQHHERLDGSGYPAGLSGEEIMLEARILGVADVVETMASHRPYRAALGIDRALEEISENSGILYDPRVVDACLMVFTEKGFKFE